MYPPAHSDMYYPPASKNQEVFPGGPPHRGRAGFCYTNKPGPGRPHPRTRVRPKGHRWDTSGTPATLAAENGDWTTKGGGAESRCGKPGKSPYANEPRGPLKPDSFKARLLQSQTPLKPDSFEVFSLLILPLPGVLVMSISCYEGRMMLLVVGAFLCLFFWVSLYSTLCTVNGSRSYEWNCRLVTLVHGILVVCITTYIGYVDGPWPFANPGAKNTPLQTSALVLSLSYFIYDMAWCVYFRTEGAVMLAHHTMTILGILSTLWLGESGIEGCAVLFGSEITNPLLQARWFLKQTGNYETWLGNAVDVLFVLLFALMRVFVGGTMLYFELISPRPKFFIKFGGVAIYIVSWIFMVDIVRFALRKSKKWQNEQRDQPATVSANGHKTKNE